MKNNTDKIRILIAEDDPIIGMDLKSTITSLGYETIDVVVDGAGAVRQALEHKPDLIMMDIFLKGELDGIEAAVKIQKEYDVPVVYLTAHGEEEIFSRAMETNHYGYIVKPAGRMELNSAIKTALLRKSVEKGHKESMSMSHVPDYSKDTLESVLDNFDEPIAVMQDGMGVYRNPAYEEIIGYSVHETSGMKMVDIVVPEDRDRAIDNLKKLLSGEILPEPIEVSITTKSGNLAALQMIPRKFKYLGKDAYMIIMKDVTSQGEEQITIDDIKEKYSALFERSRDVIYIHDLEGNFLDVNDTALDIFGYSRDEIKDVNFASLLSADQVQAAYASLERLLEGKEAKEMMHYRLKGKNGKIVWIETKGSVIYKEGSARAIIGIGRDITDRKAAERAIDIQRDLGFRLSGITEIEPALEMVTEASIEAAGMDSGGIYLVNPHSGALELLFSAGLSKNFVESISHLGPETPQAQLVMLGRTITVYSDKKENEKVEALITDPEMIREGIKAFAAIPILYQGKVIACMNIASHDSVRISSSSLSALESIGSQVGSAIARLRAEERIRQSLKEKDNLLREINHRVKNNLQIMTSLLNLEEDKIVDEEIRKHFITSKNRIRAMSLVHERLYSLDNLSKIDFSDYLKNLGNEIVKSLTHDSDDIHFIVNADDIILNVNQAIPCGLIVNELVTNSVKYAFAAGGAERKEIIISLREIDDDMLEMQVRDNGAGIADDLDFHNAVSFGLGLVSMIAEKQLNGTFSIESINGTVCTIIFKPN